MESKRVTEYFREQSNYFYALSQIPASELEANPDTRPPWDSRGQRMDDGSRNFWIRRSTFAYIAGVTRPVCVFCWLG